MDTVIERILKRFMALRWKEHAFEPDFRVILDEELRGLTVEKEAA
jgi:hypothetical protein